MAFVAVIAERVEIPFGVGTALMSYEICNSKNERKFAKVASIHCLTLLNCILKLCQ